MQAVQNLGLAVIAMVAGTIVDVKVSHRRISIHLSVLIIAYSALDARCQGYLWLEVFFLAWLSLALMAAVLLFVTDHVKKGGLNFSATMRYYIT
jgi:hypothetical protein